MDKPFRRVCFLCNRWESDYNRLQVHHLIGGRGRRQISDRYGLTVTLCRECHEKAHHNKEVAAYLHRYGQRKAMQQQGWTTAEFIKIFGKNYL